jgi:hypothetical protein
MQKINFKYTSGVRVFQAEGANIEITYHGFSEAKAQEVFKIVKKSMEMAPPFLRDHGMQTKYTCEDYSIDLYDLPKDVLNDHRVMTFMNQGRPFSPMSGLYDSEDSAPGKSAIFISASKQYSERARRKILSHELLHYWQERTCNNRLVERMQAQAKIFEKIVANSFEASL